MAGQDQLGFKVVISSPTSSLKQLEKLRADLVKEVEQGLGIEHIEVEHPLGARSLDPVVIGAIGMILLPVAADKLGDVLVGWVDRHRECTITMEVPVSGVEALRITYNPNDVSNEQLKNWIAEAKEIAQGKIE